MATKRRENTLVPVGFRGLTGWCTGWAADGTGTIYVSFIGRKTALEGIWAAFQSNEALKLREHQTLAKRNEPEAAHYYTLRSHLPETGWQHLVLLHSQATINNLHDATFYLISQDPEPPIDRFWSQWNNALPLPALPEWVSRFWHEGVSTGLITPCLAEGIYCWRVEADREEWSNIIEQIILQSEVHP